MLLFLGSLEDIFHFSTLKFHPTAPKDGRME